MKPLLTPSGDSSALDHWHRLAAVMHRPSFELDVEEFSLLLSAFRAAQREGHEFDRGMVALMGLLDRQAHATDDDTDADLSVDDYQELDDPHVGMEDEDDRESDGCDDEGTQPTWHETFTVDLDAGKVNFTRKGAA